MPYIPPNTHNMKDATYSRIILGLQGASCTGKTWSALTFPNPVVAAFEDGLVAHKGRDIIVVPFYDTNYCVNVLKAQKVGQVINRRDAFKSWLNAEAPKLEAEQTLIVDSWTSLQNAFDQITSATPIYTKKGEKDEFAFWALKIDFSCDIMQALVGLRCHIVVTFHEQQQRDPASGQLLTKIEPLMQGKYVNQLKNPFTDFFRQCAIGKLDKKGQPVLVNGKPLDKDINYFWQIKSDNEVDLKTRMSRPELHIPANYSSFTY